MIFLNPAVCLDIYIYVRICRNQVNNCPNIASESTTRHWRHPAQESSVFFKTLSMYMSLVKSKTRWTKNINDISTSYRHKHDQRLPHISVWENAQLCSAELRRTCQQAWQSWRTLDKSSWQISEWVQGSRSTSSPRNLRTRSLASPLYHVLAFHCSGMNETLWCLLDPWCCKEGLVVKMATNFILPICNVPNSFFRFCLDFPG